MSDKLLKNLCTLLKHVKNGKSVLITGSAGTGKTALLKQFIQKYNKQNDIIITASTGIAALHINGATIHSLLKLNSGTTDQIVEKIKATKGLYERLVQSTVLIIDEISFIDRYVFEKISEVLSKVRNNMEPFGNISLVLCGDFAQLPPVKSNHYQIEFCFYSDLFERLGLKVINLEMPLRQEGDSDFFNILEKIRLGRVDDTVNECLQERLISKHDDLDIHKSIHIYGKNEDVMNHNNAMIDQLTEEKYLFKMSIINTDPLKLKILTQGDIVYMLNSLPCQMNTKLCIGARVYLCVNLNFKKGLVNGLFGTIEKFKIDKKDNNLYPIVKFDNIEEPVLIKKYTWRRYYKQMNIEFSQIPLLLGWSFTVHKSQGMTIKEDIVLNLDKNNIFETQQAYVALSRATRLDQIYLISYDSAVFKVDPNVKYFYDKLKAEIK